LCSWLCGWGVSDRRQHLAAQECMPGAVIAARYFASNCAKRNARWPSRKCTPPRQAVRFLTCGHTYP
jgi:hypothetical protein